MIKCNNDAIDLTIFVVYDVQYVVQLYMGPKWIEYLYLQTTNEQHIY